MNKTIDIICIGEVLIDFIGHEMSSLSCTENFHKFLGGSPTNVATNAARLGLNAALVATCGQDGFGDFILKNLIKSNVITSNVKQIAAAPTTVIFVSKSTTTPEFIAYREADFLINLDQIPDDFLAKTKILHTTCFALSKNPARNTILETAKKGLMFNFRTSIDINYSNKIWTNSSDAFQILEQYLSTKPLVKVSQDDCYRLFSETKTDAFIFEFFHNLGAETICLTKGANGVILSDRNLGVFHQEALPLQKIQDATGAGDAFWTGFLYAQLQNKNFQETINIAQKMAILKLQNLGNIPNEIDVIDYLK